MTTHTSNESKVPRTPDPVRQRLETVQQAWHYACHGLSDWRDCDNIACRNTRAVLEAQW